VRDVIVLNDDLFGLFVAAEFGLYIALRSTSGGRKGPTEI
jgi:hypothetical protein